MKEKIQSSAKLIEDDLIKFLREIIAIPSISGKENEVIKRMQREMEILGYDKIWTDPFGNLIGQIGSGKRIIAIDGHCDTVDVGNPDNWKSDPFTGDLIDRIIYGRGASDQKGGLASAIYAGKIIKEIGIPEDVTLLVVASVLEEVYEGLCWQYIINESKIVPESVILTEPTNLEIKIGQRGRMELKVETEGISCHGSAPERGENAIYKMSEIISDIKLLNNKLVKQPVFGKGSITITDIRSTAPCLCAVADSCSIHLDRRLTTGETLESSINEITDLLSVNNSKAKVFVPEYEIKTYTGQVYNAKAYYPIWLLEKEHPLVRTAMDANKSQFHKEPIVGTWIFSTNGVVTKGIYDIPTIGYGPGKEEHAHTADDQVNIKDLTIAAEFYSAFVLSL